MHLICLNPGIWPKAPHSFCCHFGLAFPDMVFAEEELPVEVAGLNSIHVDLRMQIMSVLQFV